MGFPFRAGFYRKDHLRKHTRSHIARRVKSEVTAQSQPTNGTTASAAVTTTAQTPNGALHSS